jgi:hypothetical protein
LLFLIFGSPFPPNFSGEAAEIFVCNEVVGIYRRVYLLRHLLQHLLRSVDLETVFGLHEIRLLVAYLLLVVFLIAAVCGFDGFLLRAVFVLPRFVEIFAILVVIFATFVTFATFARCILAPDSVS